MSSITPHHTCRIALVLEQHLDSMAPCFLSGSWSWWTAHGFTHYAYAMYEDESLAQHRKHMSSLKQEYSEIITLLEHCPPLSTSPHIAKAYAAFKDNLLFDPVPSHMIRNIEHFLSRIRCENKLWEQLENNKTMKVHFVDAPSNSPLHHLAWTPGIAGAREHLMAEQIDHLCQKGTGDIVFSGGAFHYTMQALLEEHGHQVLAMFLIDQKPLLQPILDSAPGIPLELIRTQMGDTHSHVAEYLLRTGHGHSIGAEKLHVFDRYAGHANSSDAAILEVIEGWVTQETPTEEAPFLYWETGNSTLFG